MRTVLTIIAIVTALCGQDFPLPSADSIRMVQEREARERAMARRIEYQLLRASSTEKPQAPPVRHLSAEEMRQLRDAMDRYFRENGRIPILWTPTR